MKKILSLILACGLICSALLAVTGCSDSGTGGGSSTSDNTIKYQEIFDHIKDCDVESVGSSMRILQTDFYIKNWLKDNAAVVSESNLVSGSDADAGLSQYIAKMKDDEKADFGVKCQAVIDADLKLEAAFQAERAKSWGADVQEYSTVDAKNINAFFEALQNALVTEDIKPSAEYPYFDEPNEPGEAFDNGTFLDLISSMSNIETSTAGSSYQLNRDTADFMTFVIDNAAYIKDKTYSEDDMKAGVAECYNKLSPSSKLIFDWNFPSVISNIDYLLEDPDLIRNMGISVAIDDYSKDKLNTLVSAVSEASGVSY